jgi:hypothetical protein
MGALLLLGAGDGGDLIAACLGLAIVTAKSLAAAYADAAPPVA